MVEAIEERFEDAQFFAERGTKGLYASRAMARERDVWLHKFPHLKSWRSLRGVAHHHALRSFQRAHADNAADESAHRALVATGKQEPASELVGCGADAVDAAERNGAAAGPQALSLIHI